MEKQPDWEKGYYVGQEFVEDSNRENVTIDVFFYSPAQIESFAISAPNGKKIRVKQEGVLVAISFEQLVSHKLIEELMWGKRDDFIIGYISKYLPLINGQLLDQRYSSGHFLIKTFSTLDIYKMTIKVPSLEKEIGVIALNWPKSVAKFPPVQGATKEKDEIYMRDFIDAGNSYFTGNYDDCIRKIITSVENSFRHYKLSPKQMSWWQIGFSWILGKKYKFNRIVNDNIYSENVGRKTIAKNLLFLYKLRNKIVHEKFRIRPENGWVAKKGIGTLHYLYQFLSGEGATSYAFYQGTQFLLLDNLLKGQDLDLIEKRLPEKEKATYINNPQQMDDFMFGGLAISEKEQTDIWESKLPDNFY